MLHSGSIFYSCVHVSSFNLKTCLSFWEIFLYYFFGHFPSTPCPVFSCSIFPELGLVSLQLIVSREFWQHGTDAFSLLRDVWASAGGSASEAARSHSQQGAAAKPVSPPGLLACPHDLVAGFPDSEGSKRPTQRQQGLSGPALRNPMLPFCSWAARASQPTLVAGRDHTGAWLHRGQNPSGPSWKWLPPCHTGTSWSS